MKKAFILLLAAQLLLTAVLPISAVSEFVCEQYEESDSPYVFGVTDNYDRISTKSRSALPDSFDLRDIDGVSLLSEVRNQRNTNSCWAFTSLSCLETYLKRQAYENEEILADYDFSERHMEHATYAAMLDGTNSYAPTYRKANNGGNVVSAAGYFQNGLGPVSESSMPFENKTDILSRADIQIAPAASVRAMRYFPKFTGNIFDYNYHELITGIKEEIYFGGGVSAVMNTNVGSYNKDGSAYYSAETTGTANHAIMLVGWDDNYSRENFGVDKPDGDGAWIVRNSAGTSVHDNGYFYLSYENLDTYNMCFAVTDASDDIFYDNVYSVTSGTWVYGSGYEHNNNTAYAANIYQKQKTAELLTDVGLNIRGYTEYEIYVNDKNGDLSSENLTLAAKGTQNHMGFITVTLPEPVLLTGTEFSIVIKYVTPEYNYSVPVSILPYCPEIPQDCSFLSPNGEYWEETSQLGCVVGIYGYTTDCADKSAISFTKPEKAFITVYSEDGTRLRSKADGSYALSDGTYCYTAEEQSLGIATGTFSPDGVSPQNIEISESDFNELPNSNLPYVKIQEITYRANVEAAEFATLNMYMGKADSFQLTYENDDGELIPIDEQFIICDSDGKVRIKRDFLEPFIENDTEELVLSVLFFTSDGDILKTDACRIVFKKTSFGNLFNTIANLIYNPTKNVDATYVESIIKQNLAVGGQVSVKQYDVVHPTKTQNGYLLCDILVLDTFSGRYYQFQFDGEIPRVLHKVSLTNGNYHVTVRNNADGINTVSLFAEYDTDGRLLSVTYKDAALIESSFYYPDNGNHVKIFAMSSEDYITPLAPLFDSDAK